MKKLCLLLFVVFAFSALSHGVSVAGTVCNYDGTGAIIATTGVGAQCSPTPQGYDVTIYQLRLCKADPATGATPDFSTCSVLINGGAQSVHIGVGSSIELANVTLPAQGTYGYAVLVASNSIGITLTQTYTAAMVGSAGGTGTTCWTVAGLVKQQVPTPNLVACGATAAPAATIDKLDNFGNGGGNDPSAGGVFNGLSSTVAVTGGNIYAKLATTDLTAATGANFPDGITRILAVESFTTPVVIGAQTTSLNIGFNVSNSVSSWITGGAAGTAAGGTIRQYAAGPFSITISAN